MKYEETFNKIKNLAFDTKFTVCKDGNVEIYVLRPSILPARFKSYNVEKNFQIFLKEDSREFRPNHLRVMIDLSLRSRSRPDLKFKLSKIFDNIFYKKDPDEEIKLLEKEEFAHYLNSLKIIANLVQLFMIEQEYNYERESKFDPPTLFLQGWIRQFINDADKEIDNLCMSVCNGQPPKAMFVDKENKKNKKKYQDNLPEQWYLGSNN